MVTTKTVADLLTFVRFCLAGFMVWIGGRGGAGALPTVVIVLILAWVTDVLDGPLARRDPLGRRTWIGDRDLEVDMSVGLAVLAYLTLAGYLTLKVAIGYVVICVALVWYFRSPHLGWAIQAPPYFGLICAALRDAPGYGLAVLSYIALVIVVTWPRFPQMVVPEFLEGMRNLGKSRAAHEKASKEGEGYLEDGDGNSHRWHPL